jgi:hypothetical protein
MTPFRYFALVMITLLAIVALAQIPLVQDLITASGYAPGEVWSGFAGILLVFYTLLAVGSRR